MSDLACKVVAFSTDPGFNSDECVDWAVDMLALGHQSESLMMLAALSKPTNHFETIDYLRRAFGELGLVEKSGMEGIRSYSSYYIRKIANGEEVRKNLNQIRLYGLARGYESIIHDFYLLCNAWEDIDDGREPSLYWTGANKNNIGHLVVEKAQLWLAENNLK